MLNLALLDDTGGGGGDGPVNVDVLIADQIVRLYVSIIIPKLGICTNNDNNDNNTNKLIAYYTYNPMHGGSNGGVCEI